MNKRIRILTISYVLFLVLLLTSASLSGVVSDIVNILAFILPIIVAIRLSGDVSYEITDLLVIRSVDFKRSLPLVAPTVSLILIISLVTSILINSLTGKTNTVEVGDSLIRAIISLALVPAVLEELLFRYLPMRLIAPYSKRGAVIISALLFSLVHLNLFTIPYAFIAGVIFMAIDIATDSIIPSIIIHFINNALSVCIIMLGDNAAFSYFAYVTLGILSLISVAMIILKRNEYKEMLLFAFEGGERVRPTVGMILFLFLTFTLAVVNLI